MNKISYSQLSMFTECPLRWKLNYVDDLSIFEYNIYLIFGNAVHEVLQKYLEVLYYDSAKNADLLDLNEMLRDRLIENFKIAKEHDDKAPCTKEDLMELLILKTVKIKGLILTILSSLVFNIKESSTLLVFLLPNFLIKKGM